MPVQAYKGLFGKGLSRKGPSGEGPIGPEDSATGRAATVRELDAALFQARDAGHRVEIGVANGQVTVALDGKTIGYTSLDDEFTRAVFGPYLS